MSQILIIKDNIYERGERAGLEYLINRRSIPVDQYRTVYCLTHSHSYGSTKAWHIEAYSERARLEPQHASCMPKQKAPHPHSTISDGV
jgi:hypothetical protein